MKTKNALQRAFSKFGASLALALALSTLTPAVYAADGTWTGGTGGTWDTTAINWSGVSGTPWDSANGPNNNAIFNTASLNAPVSGTVYANGITFSNTGGLGSGTINLAGTTPTINNSVAATILSILAGTAGLAKNGTGILTIGTGNLSDIANTYSGTTTINTGEINLRNQSGLGSSSVTVAGGAMLRIRAINNATVYTISNPMTVAGTGSAGLGAVRSQNGINTIQAKVTLSANAMLNCNTLSSLTVDVASGNAIEANNFDLTLSGAGTLSVNDTIALGTGGLIKESSSTANLNAANTHSGTTTLTAGTLALGHVNALQNSTLDTGTLNARALTFTVGGVNTYNLGGLKGDLAINNTGNTLSVGANNENTANTGVFSGSGGLTKVGSGTLTWGNQQLYTGVTKVEGGTLALSDVRAVQNSTLDTGAAGAQTVTFTAPGPDTYFLGGLQGADDLDFGANSINVGANNASTVYSGILSGGGLTKVGSGTLTLSGNNTYTGSTAITNGTLLVNGSISAGAVTVKTNATLGGTGAIGGNVTFEAGAMAQFTNGAPLTISGTLTVNDNSVHLRLPAKLARGSYTLATYQAAGSSGAFASVPVIDSGSLAGTGKIITGDGQIVLKVFSKGTIIGAF